MEELNMFVINFIGWMIAVIIIGSIYLELLRCDRTPVVVLWIFKIMFLVSLIGGPVLALINL